MWREFIELVEKRDHDFTTLCARYGISRKTGYKWLKRYRTEGASGLTEQSRRPKSSPRRTPDHVVDALLTLRSAYPEWSVARLREEMVKQKITPIPAPSTIDLILRRQRESAEKILPRAPEPPATESNFRWKLTYGPEVTLQDGTVTCVTMVQDEATEFIVGATVPIHRREEALVPFVIKLLQQQGLPWRLQIQRPAELRDQSLARSHSALTVELLRHGIIVEFSYGPAAGDPTLATPESRHLTAHLAHLPAYQSAPLSNRTRRTDPAELFSQAAPHLTYASAVDCLDQLREQHNFSGRHEAMQQGSPVSSYRPSTRRMALIAPTPVALPQTQVRLISEKGIFTFQRRLVHVGRVFARMKVQIRHTPYSNRYHVIFAGQFLGSFNPANAPIDGTTSLLLSRA